MGKFFDRLGLIRCKCANGEMCKCADGNVQMGRCANGGMCKWEMCKFANVSEAVKQGRKELYCASFVSDSFRWGGNSRSRRTWLGRRIFFRSRDDGRGGGDGQICQGCQTKAEALQERETAVYLS